MNNLICLINHILKKGDIYSIDNIFTPKYIGNKMV